MCLGAHGRPELFYESADARPEKLSNVTNIIDRNFCLLFLHCDIDLSVEWEVTQNLTTGVGRWTGESLSRDVVV